LGKNGPKEYIDATDRESREKTLRGGDRSQSNEHKKHRKGSGIQSGLTNCGGERRMVT